MMTELLGVCLLCVQTKRLRCHLVVVDRLKYISFVLGHCVVERRYRRHFTGM